MGLLLGLLDGALCVILYVRMCKREVPEPMGKKAAIPVALGLFAPLLSTALLVGIGLLALQIMGGDGQSLASFVPTYTLKSFVGAFLGAAFPEEFIKFFFVLLAIKLVKPKSIYECGLLGAGVGTGFTFLEQMLYGGTDPVSALVRMPFFAMHLVFDLIMALFLGLSMYEKRSGRGGAKKYAVLAFVVPVLWHTIFDAATTFNRVLQVGLETEDIFLRNAGAVFALIVLVVSIALQIWLLIQYKKRTEELCAMGLTQQSPRPHHSKSER